MNARSKALRVILVAGFMSAGARADDNADRERMRSVTLDAKVSLAQAVEIAAREVRNGRPYKAVLEMEDGAPRYVVSVVERNTWVVEIDAASGRVIRKCIVLDQTEEALPCRWSFEPAPAGEAPPGWLIRQTNPTKAMGDWLVVADPAAPSKPHILRLKTQNERATFNLALAERTSFRNVDLTVWIRADQGAVDQGGGSVWRCRDENHYYVCRINPLESNFRVYKVVNGTRTQLQSADVGTEAGR